MVEAERKRRMQLVKESDAASDAGSATGGNGSTGGTLTLEIHHTTSRFWVEKGGT